MTIDEAPSIETAPRLSSRRAVARWLELLILFAAIPLIFWWTRTNPDLASDLLARVGVTGRLAEMIASGRLMIPTLLVFAIALLVVIVRDPGFDNRRLWNWNAGRREIPRILAIFIPGAALLSLSVWAFQPASPIITQAAARGLMLPALDPGASWLNLPRNKPQLWLLIMVAYPVVSVWPQEVLYRAFFHHRYRAILPTPAGRIIVGALAFAFMHIVFLNWLAPVLTLPGALLFAWTYERSKSLAAVSIEHALWGCLAFTIGIGWYFYGGNITG